MEKDKVIFMFYQWNIIGHQPELTRLEEDLRSNSVHHAYLLVGPEMVGKFRVAKSMAQILQCHNNFCHTCPDCTQIDKKIHPDTMQLDDDGESIKIDAVREIIARLSMTGQSRHKILLIDNIGRLTDEASNCLLKTLEEPSAKTIFIFTASQLRDIMPTIASRMRIMHFKKLHDDVLKIALQKLYPDEESATLDQAILLSLGRSGRAIKLIQDPEMFQELRDIYHQIQFLEEKASPAKRMVAMQEISADPQKIKVFLQLLAHYFRRNLLQTSSDKGRQRAIRIIEEIHRVTNLLSQNVNPRLLMENIMLAL